jgi:hypothetical protein
MLSSVGAASAEAASDTHEEKGALLPGMSDAVENSRLVPVTLLTASSAIFTWTKILCQQNKETEDSTSLI